MQFPADAGGTCGKDHATPQRLRVQITLKKLCKYIEVNEKTEPEAPACVRGVIRHASWGAYVSRSN